MIIDGLSGSDNTIKSFLDMLSVLEQYPDYKWSDIIGSVNVKQEDDDEFSSFRL